MPEEFSRKIFFSPALHLPSRIGLSLTGWRQWLPWSVSSRSFPKVILKHFYVKYGYFCIHNISTPFQYFLHMSTIKNCSSVVGVISSTGVWVMYIALHVFLFWFLPELSLSKTNISHSGQVSLKQFLAWLQVLRLLSEHYRICTSDTRYFGSY